MMVNLLLQFLHHACFDSHGFLPIKWMKRVEEEQRRSHEGHRTGFLWLSMANPL